MQAVTLANIKCMHVTYHRNPLLQYQLRSRSKASNRRRDLQWNGNRRHTLELRTTVEKATGLW